MLFRSVSQSRYFNVEQAKAIPAQILQGWEDLTKKGKALIVQREQMEAYVQDVFNRYDLGKKVWILKNKNSSKTLYLEC